MPDAILITGGSGFLGRRLLERLDFSRFPAVYCLMRRPPRSLPSAANLHIVEGSLDDPAHWREILSRCRTVVHLAAVTGKATRREHFAGNLHATETLLRECRSAGVERFLFTSTIAAQFRHTGRYFYAQAKIAAERAVRESGLAFTIVRPTMIIGPGSPVLDGLARMSALPLFPVFGRGRTPVQPIEVTDLADRLAGLLHEDRFQGETLAAGGPDVLSIEEFMTAVRRFRRLPEKKPLHLPLSLVLPVLAVLEPLAYRFMPLTIGQLATFRDDGSCGPTPPLPPVGAAPGVAAMLEAAQEPPPAPPPVDPAELERECRRFTPYLCGLPADERLLRNYAQANQARGFAAPGGRFDRLLLRLAVRHHWLTRTCDIYSRFFHRRGVLRKKLVYLLAILEVTAPYHRHFDDIDSRSLAGFALQCGMRGFVSVSCLLFGAIFLLPLQILLGGDKQVRHE